MNNVTGFDAKDSKAARGQWEILEPKAHSKGSNFHLLQDMGSFPLVRSKQGEDCSDFKKQLVQL